MVPAAKIKAGNITGVKPDLSHVVPVGKHTWISLHKEVCKVTAGQRQIDVVL